MAKYGSIVTLKGKEKIAAAMLQENKRINLTHFAAGDGGGAYYQPTEAQEALKAEKWRGSITTCKVADDSPNMIEIVGVIPPNEGGFTIREIAAFDESGDMIVIANTPDTEKVIISSGAAGEIKLSIFMEISNAETVQLKIDPNTVTATKKELEDHNNNPNAHEGRFASKSALDAHTANADIHITAQMKENYNQAFVGLAEHKENAEIHVTATQKQGWQGAVDKSNQNEAEIARQQAEITTLKGKLARLEDGVYNNITGNPWTLTFGNLDGIELTKGNHNRARGRIEC